MSNVKISLVASAVRPRVWKKFYDSLLPNKIDYEVIFVGDVEPTFKLPDNFKWIYSNTKPAQCYEIGFRAAQGELVAWTADDAVYNCGRTQNSLDIIYDYYKKEDNPKRVVAQRPIEDGGDIWRVHRFFYRWENTPFMAPFGFINREFFHELGGYDKNFICGQTENDIIMRVYEAGGSVDLCMDSYVHVDHRNVHEITHSNFRQYYDFDRQELENSWVVGGYGAYGAEGKQMRPTVEISKTRLKPVDRFDDKDITTKTQGAVGLWDTSK